MQKLQSWDSFVLTEEMVMPENRYPIHTETDPDYYRKLRSLVGKKLEIFGSGWNGYGVSDPSLDEDIDIPSAFVDPHLP